MVDKKVIKQNGENPIAMIDSNIFIKFDTDGKSLEEMKHLNKDVRKDLQDTKQKIGSLKGYLTNIINKGFEKIRGNIGYDFALNMNSLQRGGSFAPPLSYIVLERTSSLSTHVPYIHNLNWLHIYGDVLTGKTHYLHLLAKEINHEETFWIKCKNLNSEQAVMTIKVTLSEITRIQNTTDKEWFDKVAEKLGYGTVIILDDLPSFNNNDILYDNLAHIYSAFRKHGVKIISSGSISLNQRLIKNFNKEIATVQVPLFTSEDIVELIHIKNDKIENAQNLAFWIGAVTKYNPALVVACVEYIESKNWDITTEVYNNIQEGFYSLELSREVRDLLLNDIDDIDTKELLYRLSLINNDFDNRYVDSISEITPQVIHPYDKLHILEGYWLQRTNLGYRVSPFVDKIGASNLPSNIIKEIHSRIAQILKQAKILSPLEFVNMFSQLIKAEEFNNAAYSLYLALTELNKSDLEKDYWGISSIWYDSPFPDKIGVEIRLLIRAKQIITCLKFGKEVTYLLKDLDNFDEDNQFIGAIYLMLSIELLEYNLDLSLKYLERFYSLTNETIISEHFKENIEQLIWFYPLKLDGDFEITNRLLNIIDNMSEEQLKNLFLSEMSYDSARLLVDKIWINECRLDEHLRKWDRCIQLFNKIKDIGEKKRNPILYACAVRALIIVTFEYQNKEEVALSLYEDALSFDNSSDSLFLLHAIMGKQYIYKKKYEEATSYLLSALKLNSTNYPFEVMDTSFYVAKCFENIDPPAVIRYLKRAIEINCKQEIQNELINVKLLGEIGIHYFNETMFFESYNYFRKAIFALRKIEDKNDDWKSLVVVYGHVLGYIYILLGTGSPPTVFHDGEPYAKPSLGFFWIDNEKRHQFYNYQREIHLNTAMGLFAGDVKKYDDAFYWLNLTEQEIKCSNNLNIIDIFNTKEIVPYLILKNDLNEAINRGIEFSIFIEASKFRTTQEKVVLETSDIDNVINNSDKLYKAIELSFVYVFIPVMFSLSELKIKDKEDIQDIVQSVVKNLEVIKKKYGDCGTFDTLIKIFTMTFLENHDQKEYLNDSNEYSDYEKLMLYVAISLVSTKRDALEAHLTIVQYLYTLFKGEKIIFLKIVTTFFKSFWMYSYISNRFDFQNTDIIDANLDGILKGNDINTLKQLLNLMNLGFEVPISQNVLDFLKS
ncbi:hypothetical protein ACDZ29_25595 [Peribacillus sp. RS7]|uniref:tetratricopeptide repeat protein n=1 Tax=Peribacillus sp. RS7 TaxID=3242679 RepID=UPI0035BFE171